MKKENREQTNQKKEKFFDIQIPLENLYYCEMFYNSSFLVKGQRLKKIQQGRTRILEKVTKNTYKNFMIERQTYKEYSSFFDPKLIHGEIGILLAQKVEFPEEIQKKGYLTIREILEYEKELIQKDKLFAR